MLISMRAYRSKRRSSTRRRNPQILKSPEKDGVQYKRHQLFVCDFALHSIGLLLFRRKQHEVFREFLQDVIGDAGVAVVSLTPQELDSLADVAAGFNLDSTTRTSTAPPSNMA
jgi:hypothetical protein